MKNNLIMLKKTVKIIEGEKKSLVCNMDNGRCVFISKECVDIIKEAIKEKITFEDLLESIEDSDSRKYMCDLIEKVDEYEMWSYGNNEKIYSEAFSISVDITNDCNLRCKHCCVSAGESTGKDLSYKELTLVLDKVIALSPREITISGGEPLFRDDFIEITAYIREKYEGNLVLMTNATLIDERMAKYIAQNYNCVDISIDGYDEKSCSFLRGEGVFQKVINGIKLLKNNGMDKISASMVVINNVPIERRKFIDLCKTLGIGYTFRSLELVGRAENLNIERNGSKGIENIHVINPEKISKIRPQIFACQASKRVYQIGYRGDIFPCGALMGDEFILGNVLEVSDLKEYLEERKFEGSDGYRNLELLMPYNIPGCKGCGYEILCFSCANEVRRHLRENDFTEICHENKKYFSCYWRNNETN